MQSLWIYQAANFHLFIKPVGIGESGNGIFKVAAHGSGRITFKIIHIPRCSQLRIAHAAPWYYIMGVPGGMALVLRGAV